MNERIREILGQCQHESIDGPEYPRWTDLEKFAELIVRECANVASSITPPIVSDLILEHFGVEE